ncbi:MULTISPECIES: DUF2157 domain-containing protein [unclassified Coleofasciculus]|uniref:DUF2157 domain-containing protein n=1 Tax=unclassified Coleofasciculus TaxID=2692782 RepID=UPI00188101BE|nr:MULTISPECIES: DUF2157 domain-containing protein [unclassified Coleofasciculus]MBE9125354.1 DUF2157 domain-containing protein [Coleofasciculus sp. LEGE 07081]MBE9148557.1 DUF2157 domain-containing protein [Coleofasciculus sp. LEGE 07092]
MLSEKFRRQLRQEAEQWHAEGLIDADAYEQLAQRYQFSELQRAARNRFIAILLVLGSIFLGLGIITFVVANWHVWSRELRVTLLLTMFVGFNTAGFYLWKYPAKGWQRRLGQGLLLVGALMLGVNMALMAQMFHKSGPIYQLYLVWGVGVLAMAYSLRLTTLGILSALLIGIGYLRGQVQPDYLLLGEWSWLRLMVLYMPILAGVMFIPLAYWCRSRWIFGIGAIAVIYSLEANLLNINLLLAPPWVAAVACGLPPALLWGYSDSLWVKDPSTAKSFTSIARTLAVIFLSLLFFLLSFYSIWNSSFVPSARDSFDLSSHLLVNILMLGGLTIWKWLHLLRHLNLTTSIIAVMIATSAVVIYWHLATTRLEIVALLSFNILLFILAIGLIRKGLARTQRRLFWGGIVLLNLQILSRMLEYNTELLFKSIVLLVCGLGVIGAGLWFERYLRTKEV